MAPLVSILIPAYNAERWIGETIRSALAQTWPRKELIIVNDGSRDRTLEVARQFASAGQDRLRVSPGQQHCDGMSVTQVETSRCRTQLQRVSRCVRQKAH